MGVRSMQAVQLTVSTMRVVRWQPVPAAAALSALVLWWQRDRLEDLGGAVWMLRVVAVLLAASVAFALDDRTRATLAAVPTPLWWRAGTRLVMVGVPALLAWALAAVWVGAQVPTRLPLGGLTLEAAALSMISLAVAGGLSRWWELPDAGTVTGPAALGLGLLIPRLPERVELTVLPGQGWDAAHLRWATLLLLAAAVLVLTLRDPARRPVGRAWRAWASPSRCWTRGCSGCVAAGSSRGDGTPSSRLSASICCTPRSRPGKAAGVARLRL